MIKFHFTRYPSDAVIEPALRTLRNIVYGDDAQTQVERTIVLLSSDSCEIMFVVIFYIIRARYNCGSRRRIIYIFCHYRSCRTYWYQQAC